MIERIRDERTYYVFPGGGLAEGETPQEAMIREVHEELGLLVSPERLLAEVQTQDEPQLYFLAREVGGRFGQGVGKEVRGLNPPEDGIYNPVLVAFAALKLIDGWPRKLLDVVADVPAVGWPDHVLRFREQPSSPDAGHTRAA